MTRIFLCWGALLLFTAPAQAQEAAQPAETSTEPMQEAPAAEEKDEGSGIYEKKVKGLLWIEATAGPSAYKPTSFKSISLGTTPILQGKASGPEFGFAGGFNLSGFMLGVRFKKASYTGLKLLTVGLDMGTMFTSVPYVHPFIKFALNYNGIRNSPGTKGDGGGVLLGLGVRVPVIKWISIAISFDYTVIGMYVRSSVGAGTKEGVAGNQLAGTFALTFHPF